MAEREAYWWRGCNWLEWIDEIGVVERPTEDACMRRLAFQTVKAMDHLAKVHDFIFRDHAPSFRDLVKEVLTEERAKKHGLTLREVHAGRGVELQWVEKKHRGGLRIEVIEVTLPKSA